MRATYPSHPPSLDLVRLWLWAFNSGRIAELAEILRRTMRRLGADDA